jgi:preprotein translocase subunit SecA
MIGFFAKKIFGTKSQRDIKKLEPILENINNIYENISNISNEDLRDKIDQIKEKINNFIKNENQSKLEVEKKIKENYGNIFFVIKKQEELELIKKKIDDKLSNILNEVLAEVFAIVKEICKRFSKQNEIIVKARDYDKKFANDKDYVEIIEENAIWKNSWDANGVNVLWNMIPYDVQIIGGIILHQGKIAEMATGEGKTLTSVMPIFLNALSGQGVHVVTVNDYLSKRDSRWNAPIFNFFGITVDCIDDHESNSEERKKAYEADIVYGTNNEFGFDYLRDNMANSPEDVVQKNHYFAIVDEVDSVLIDDARTPLIISGPVKDSNEKDYLELKPTIELIFEEQKKLVTDFFIDAKDKIEKGEKDKGGLSLFRVYRGLPKYKPLIKYLSEKGINQILYKTENYYLQENSKMMPEADEPLFFTIEEKNNVVEFTEKGLKFISDQNFDSDFFVLPDISKTIVEIDSDQNLSFEEKEKKKSDIFLEFKKKTQRLHITKQLLKAYCIFEKNDEYIVDKNQVKIVDEQTGRILGGRRYSDGLHQAIEAKENVEIKPLSQTYASITLQNYFKMYKKISGMTGTAITEAGEFWEIYKLDVIETPTNRPLARIDKDDMIYKTMREKFNAVIEEVKSLVEKNRPVLVGTTSVENSELISKLLKLKKIPHQVLNAKYHDLEADIISKAGIESTVTIATNMAGRGTDIKLTQKSKESGGLAIVGTERHESRRVDRQLRGRSGRQGDVGSSQFFLSLEDPLMRLFGSDKLVSIFDKIGMEEGEVIQHSMVTRSIEKAQKRVEEGNFSVRKRLLEYDNVMSYQRNIIYKIRKNALFKVDINLEISFMIFQIVYNTVENYFLVNDLEKFEKIEKNLKTIFGEELSLKTDSLKKIKDKEILTKKIYEICYSFFKEREQEKINFIENSFNEKNEENLNFEIKSENSLNNFIINKSDLLEKNLLLNNFYKKIILERVDDLWKNHLKNMDDLRQYVQNVVYEKKDPILIYKIDSYDLFKDFLNGLYSSILKQFIFSEIKKSNIFDKNLIFKEFINKNDNPSLENLSDIRQKIKDLLKNTK